MTPISRPGGFAIVLKSPFAGSLSYSDGCAFYEHNVKFSTASVCNAGSVAKQFTAFLVNMAATTKRLSLDDPVTRWLPEAAVPEKIQVDHLLHHTSGIRDADALMGLMGMREHDFYTRWDLVYMLERMPGLMFEPGSNFCYGNSNYVLLGLIAQRAWNSGLADLAKEQLFYPAGMSASRFRIDPDELIPGFAASYRLDSSSRLIRRSDRITTIVGPAGLFTSCEDLMRWLVYRDELLAADRTLRRYTHAPATLTTGTAAPYGAGIFLRRQEDGTTWYCHGGHEHGYSAYLAWSTGGCCVACACNQHELDAAEIGEHAMQLLLEQRDVKMALQSVRSLAANLWEESLALPATPDAAPQPEPLDRDVRARWSPLAGRYGCPDLPINLIIELIGDDLIVRRGSATDKFTITSADCAEGPGCRITAPKRNDNSLEITIPRAGTIRLAKD